MSQYPATPSYAGSANYAPQWSAQPPHSSSGRPDPAFFGNYATMPFNSNPPTQLPGLGMANGLGPTTYFTQNLPESQISAPFATRLNGAGAYPPDSSLPNPSFGLSQPPKPFPPPTSHITSGLHEHSFLPAHNDTDREEGEVSDFSGNDIAVQPSGPFAREIYSTGPLPMQGNDNYEPTSISSSDNNRSSGERSESRKAHYFSNIG